MQSSPSPRSAATPDGSVAEAWSQLWSQLQQLGEARGEQAVIRVLRAFCAYVQWLTNEGHGEGRLPAVDGITGSKITLRTVRDVDAAYEHLLAPPSEDDDE